VNILRTAYFVSLTFGVLLILPSVVAAGPDGAALYKKKCAVCHGKQGVPPKAFARQGVQNHRDPEWQEATSDEDIRKVITEGAKGTMMRAFRKEFKADEIEALVKHIRSLRRQE
jgi:mono/diheme cytochrome c family protein